jgi:hypothetical protein
MMTKKKAPNNGRFVKGDPRISAGRKKGSKNKSRAINNWDAVTDKYSLKAADVMVTLLRKGSESAKRKIAIQLLETHRKILEGKVEAPDAYKAKILRHSAEALDTLVWFLNSKEVKETSKLEVVRFFNSNTLAKIDQKEKELENKKTSDTQSAPVLSLASFAGKKMKPKAPLTDKQLHKNLDFKSASKAKAKADVK